jgi:phospholipid/cholesterol/gamma-HCH transport system ATP-binding protein
VATAEIRVHDLHKSFQDKPVLAGIDLEVFQGDVLAVVGGSGCGKTVLLNHILGQLVADRGYIEVVNHDLDGEPLVDLRDVGEFELDGIHKHWGVVFQRNALFSGTVFHNIALWLREVKGTPAAEIRAIAERTLADVGLPNDGEFLELPQEKLSGGMAKRLAVARALAMDPVVIFYDEPTTGLDPISASQIHALIQQTHEAMARRTTVIITHDKDLLTRLRPRTVMLHEGRVFFDGSFEQFEDSDSPIIRPYFELMPVLQTRPLDMHTVVPSEQRRGLLV